MFDKKGRPLPFVGMLLYRKPTIGTEGWARITGIRENSHDEHIADYKFLGPVIGTGHLSTFIPPTSTDLDWWNTQIKLPGEKDCPPILEEFQHKWETGDQYFYYSQIRQWVYGIYREGLYNNTFKENAIYVPAGTFSKEKKPASLSPEEIVSAQPITETKHPGIWKVQYNPYFQMKNKETWEFVKNHLKGALTNLQISKTCYKYALEKLEKLGIQDSYTLGCIRSQIISVQAVEEFGNMILKQYESKRK